MLRERNALAPVNQLPVELFLRICMQSLALLRHPQRPTAHLLSLSTVSSQWYHVLTSRPASALWSTIICPTPGTPAALKHSQNVPLDVMMIMSNGEVQAREKTALALGRELDRCGVVRWYGGGGDRLLESLSATSSLKELRELTLNTTGGSTIQIRHIPRLSKLTLVGTPFRFDQALLPSVTRLTLTELSNHDLPPLLKLVQSIAGFPSLEELNLSALGYGREIPPHGLGTPHPPVCLLKLLKLSLDQLVEDVVIFFLRLLEAPLLCHLSLGDDRADIFRTERFIEFLVEEDPTQSIVHSTLRSAVHEILVITVTPRVTGIHLGGEHALSFPVPSPGSVSVNILLDALGISHLNQPIHLHLSPCIDGFHPDEHLDTTFLTRLRSLEVLEYSYPRLQQAVPVLQRVSCTDGAGERILARLREMHFTVNAPDWGPSDEEVAEFLQALRSFSIQNEEVAISDGEGAQFGAEKGQFMGIDWPTGVHL